MSLQTSDFSCAQKTSLLCWMQDAWGGNGSVTWVSLVSWISWGIYL